MSVLSMTHGLTTYREQRTGTARPCVLTSLMEEAPDIKDPPPDIEEYIRNTAGAAYAAGSDTVHDIMLRVPQLSLIVASDGLDNNDLCAGHGSEPRGTTESSR